MEANSLSVEHFPDICRFCLVYASTENPQYPLFLHHGQYGRFVKDSNESLPEIIISCLGLKIDPDDGLPLNICTTCETALTTTNNFRNRCFRSIDTLLEIKTHMSVAHGQVTTVPIEAHYEDEDVPTPQLHHFQTGSTTTTSVEIITLDNNKSDDIEDTDHHEYMVFETVAEPAAENRVDCDDDDEDELRTIIEPYEDDDDDDDDDDHGECGDAVYDRSGDADQHKTHDSDDEYEADLADKYESLDRKYHIAEAPSLTTTAGANIVKASASQAKLAAGGSGTTGSQTEPNAERKKPRSGRSLLPKQCYVCGLIVLRMRDHMKCHPGELQYQCELCPRSYLTKTGRDRHMDGQHPETRITTDTAVRADRAHHVQLQRALRYAGKEFVHRNGIVQSGRRMRAPCDPAQCRFKCAQRLADHHRQRAFDEYYALADVNKQWQYLAQHCDRTVPKARDRQHVYKRRHHQQRMRRNAESSAAASTTSPKKRQNNIRYFLYGDGAEEGDAGQGGGVKVFVCKTMFLATFDIGETSVATAVQKTDAEGNLIDFDRRGYRGERYT